MSATPISELFGGGATGKTLQYELAAETKTITAQWDGLADVLVIGGHGSGAAVSGTGYATGASSGEVAIAMRIPVKRGDVLTATIGAGGTAVGLTNGRLAGIDGGDTTLVIGTRTIVAKAGRGALVGTSMPLNGPRGGYGGTGGDLHVEGGPGGSVLATTSPQASAGSGAVGVLLNAPATRGGGNVNSASTGASAGGAGVGGRGGNSTGSSSFPNPSGGGAGGAGSDAAAGNPANAGANAMGQQQSASPTALVQSLASIWGFDYFGGGGLATGGSARAAGPGGGGTGVATSGTALYAAAGAFGGPGGASATSGAISGGVSNFGPGGSAATVAASRADGTAGAPGLIVVVIREG